MSDPERPLVDVLFEELDALQGSPDPQRFVRAWRLVTSMYGIRRCRPVAARAVELGLVGWCAVERANSPPADELRHQRWRNPLDQSEMIWVPPGSFCIGLHKERATCSGFSLARFPVTNAQFAAFLSQASYVPPSAHPHNDLFLRHWSKGKPPRGRENHPVVWVSYFDAMAYCRWAGLTLPTEWLWEKAARGPDGRPYPWGTGFPDSWQRKPSGLTNVRSKGTCPVGNYPHTRTPYGCEDMVGNVSEWCQMYEGEDRGHIPDDWPAVPLSEAVYTAVRGSCFFRTDHLRMRAWHRRRLAVTRRNQWVGFRPACLLPCRPATDHG